MPFKAWNQTTMIANLPVIHQEITTHSGALSPTEGSPPAPPVPTNTLSLLAFASLEQAHSTCLVNTVRCVEQSVKRFYT